MNFSLADFDYPLPPELIAQSPAPGRSGSRLLHLRNGEIADRQFTDLPALLAPGDLLILNDTRVIKARLHGAKASGGKVEVLVERLLGSNVALAQVRASKSPSAGSSLHLGGDLRAVVLGREGEFFKLKFAGVADLAQALEAQGELPLPPYIAHPADRTDEERYQTVYAREPGAVAAPTAGLHFDAAMFEALAARGVSRAFITLHVGAGTFQPVRTEDLSEHHMHSERYWIPQETVDAVAATKAAGGRVVCVGTTSLRAVEASAAAGGFEGGASKAGVETGTNQGGALRAGAGPGEIQVGALRAGAAETDLFVTPGYRFRVADLLLTNFHLPKSTLLMLVSAFASMHNIRTAYAHAIAKRYRFFSYGDCMLMERSGSGD